MSIQDMAIGGAVAFTLAIGAFFGFVDTDKTVINQVPATNLFNSADFCADARTTVTYGGGASVNGVEYVLSRPLTNETLNYKATPGANSANLYTSAPDPVSGKLVQGEAESVPISADTINCINKKKILVGAPR